MKAQIAVGDTDGAQTVFNHALAIRVGRSLPTAEAADASAIQAIIAAVKPVDESKRFCRSRTNILQEVVPGFVELLALAEAGSLLDSPQVDQILENAVERLEDQADEFIRRAAFAEYVAGAAPSRSVRESVSSDCPDAR